MMKAKKGEKYYLRLQHEAEILSKLDHSNIVKVFETYNDEKGKNFFIVIEKCAGGELFDFIQGNNPKVLTEKEAALVI
jgi:serine/threonine protein kinase